MHCSVYSWLLVAMQCKQKCCEPGLTLTQSAVHAHTCIQQYTHVYSDTVHARSFIFHNKVHARLYVQAQKFPRQTHVNVLHIHIIGASLSEPHIDHDNIPRTQNNGMYLCIYLSIYVHVCIIYPAFVAPWFPRSMYALKYSMYSGISTCSHAWFTIALDWTARTTGATRVCHQRRQLSMKTGQVNARQTHGINRFSLLRQWSCSCLANFPTCLCESKTTVEFTVLLFCDVHIDKGATLNLLHCLRVICGCRAVQNKDVDTTDTAAYM